MALDFSNLDGQGNGYSDQTIEQIISFAEAVSNGDDAVTLLVAETFVNNLMVRDGYLPADKKKEMPLTVKIKGVKLYDADRYYVRY